jgi:hypothetical protein
VSQNLFSLVFGNFSKEYQDYLRDGSQSEEFSFIKIEEFGVFRMQNATELRIICIVIIAVTLQSQDLIENPRISYPLATINTIPGRPGGLSSLDFLARHSHGCASPT